MPIYTPITHLILMDGTWGDRNKRGKHRKPTVLGSMVDLLSSPGRDIRYFPGLGTKAGLFEKYIGGGTGRGIETQIIEAIDHVVTNYNPSDTWAFIAFSRGAYAARSIVGFLDRIGIPDCNKDILHELYTQYTSGRFLQRGVADHLRAKYQCRPISIRALICLDTVGSLGIPRTGLFGIFHALAPFMKKREFLETNVASNVELICHALALHEYRRPFTPTLMHLPTRSGQILKQVWFIGAHGDIGHDKETGSLADIPFAWILQQLHDIGITCNDAKIGIRFPRTALSPHPVSDAEGQAWVYDPIKRSATGFYHLTGKTVRQPGKYFQFGSNTNESIHPTVAMRNYGVKPGKPVIEGYEYHKASGTEGTGYWESTNSQIGAKGSFRSMEPLRINESELGDYEAWLLGIAPDQDSSV